MVVQDKGHERVEERRLEHDGCAQGSLQALIREDDLFVHPLYWTNKHLRALHCGFETERVVIATTKDSPESTLQPRFEEALLDNLFRLRMKRGRKMKDIAMRWIVERIAMMFLPADQVTRGVLCLSFARNPVASIRVPLLGSDGQDANSRTMWAYIDPSFVEEQREIYQRALARRSRGLVKPHGNDGPFRPLYVAIFLAIAQHGKRVGQFYRGGGDDQMQRITLFVPNYSSPLQTTKQTPVKRNRSTRQQSTFGLTEYTTDISDTYLRKLDEPHKFFNAELQIQKRTIPINPERPIELYTAMKHACSIREEGENNRTEYRSLKRRELADISCNNGNRSDGRKRRKGAG